MGNPEVLVRMARRGVDGAHSRMVIKADARHAVARNLTIEFELATAHSSCAC